MRSQALILLFSMAGVYVTVMIGVSRLEYLSFAFVNYLSVIILVIYGFTGVTMAAENQ